MRGMIPTVEMVTWVRAWEGESFVNDGGRKMWRVGKERGSGFINKDDKGSSASVGKSKNGEETELISFKSRHPKCTPFCGA